MEKNKYRILISSGTTNIKFGLISEYQSLGLGTEIGDVSEDISGGVLTITGVTTSKLNDVKSFNFVGPSHIVGTNGVTSITDNYTGYSINNISYVTDTSGYTTFMLVKNVSTGSTDYIVFEEAYLNQAYNPITDNQININRPSVSVTETLGRFEILNSVDIIEEYAGNFFNVSKQ